VVEEYINDGKILENKTDHFDYAEYITVNIKPNQKDIEKKRTSNQIAERKFNLPLLNEVYKNWYSKNLKKISNKSKDIFNKLVIEEYEPIDTDSYIIKNIRDSSLENKSIKFISNELKPEFEEKENHSREKVFDIPIINQIYNEWHEKHI
jgi:hypothetical protein